MPVEEVHPQRLHCAGSVAAQGASLHEIMLSYVLVLKMSSHRNLSLKSSVADRAVVWQGFRVCGEMFSQVVFAKESVRGSIKYVRAKTDPKWQLTSSDRFGIRRASLQCVSSCAASCWRHSKTSYCTRRTRITSGGDSGTEPSQYCC